IAVDADDVRVIEAGEDLRLLDEAIETPAVVGSAPFRAGHNRALAVAPDEICGEVLLDRDLAGERLPAREVRDAEAARAQHALDDEVVDELGPGGEGQQIGHCLGDPFSMAASGRCTCLLAQPLRRSARERLSHDYAHTLWQARQPFRVGAV